MDRLLNQEKAGLALNWKSMERAYRYYADKSVAHVVERWIGFVVLLALFSLRILKIQGYYIVAYGLGIYAIHHLVLFLSPKSDPDADESPGLPVRDRDEFKPFIRLLPEFKFWYAMTKAVVLGLSMTFIPIFDIPAYWPILLIYWTMLFLISMRQRVKHMIKHRYVPFSIGKKRYTGKKKAAL